MHESWFRLPDFGGRYEVSDLGYVRDRFLNVEVPEKYTLSGVRWASLIDCDGSQAWRPVSKLVYTTINDRPVPEGYFIDYRDGNRKNCALSNLLLVDREPSPLPRSQRTTCLKHDHPLTSWNLTSIRKCRACKSASKSSRTPDEEFARLYEKHYGVPYMDDRAEYFDRSGIGVWDIYSGL